MSEEIKYRPEIDGLRSVAILGVMIFHVIPESLPGGFLGVDVFFVISGYLITSILYRQIQEQRFSFWNFWQRRIKRLFPALVATTAATLLAGIWFLPQPERGMLPIQAVAALFSFSNLLLWRTTAGYWSPSVENIPLLHTWSLSLEEQFYICFPIILYWGHKISSKQTPRAIASVLVLSLALCVMLTELKPTATFYLLPTRMWELLLGGLIAIYRPSLDPILNSKRSTDLTHLFGLALILLGYVMIENNEAFPGLYPLAPCLGTVLLLVPTKRSSVVVRILSTPILVYLGKISYSLYLWHWPILVYAHYTNPSSNASLIMLTSLIVAAASYHFIEQPFRSKPPRPFMWASIGAAAIILCLLGFHFLPSSPLLRKLGDFDTARAMSRGREFEATANLRDNTYQPERQTSDLSMVMLGSSHARVLCQPFDRFAEQNAYEFHSMACSGIGLTTDSNRLKPYCSRVNERRIQLVEQMAPNVAIVAGMWSFELTFPDSKALLRSRLATLAESVDTVLVFGQVPLIDLPLNYQEALRKYVTAHAISQRPIHLKPSADIAKANGAVAEIVEQLDSDRIEFIDPTDLLTTQDGFVRVFDENRFLYADYHHVNETGANVIFDALFRPRLTSRNDPTN